MPTHRNNVIPLHGRAADTEPSNEDRLRALLAGDPGSRTYVGESLEVCGGMDAFVALDAEPLTEAASDRSPLPGRAADLFDRARRALTEFAEWEIEIDQAFGRERTSRLDAETTLVIRRLLCVAADRSVLPARSSDDRVAAAVTWIALTGNMLLTRRARHSARDVWGWFGVSDAGSLGRSIADDLGMLHPDRPRFETYPWMPIRLGDARLLTAETRRWLLRQRDVAARGAEQEIERAEAAKPLRQVDGGMQLQGRDFAVANVLKLDVDGRHRVALFAGVEADNPEEILMLSVPDARGLLYRLDAALGGPAAPTRRPNDSTRRGV